MSSRASGGEGSWHRTRLGAALAGIMGVCGGLSGCDSSIRPGVQSVLEIAAPQFTPSEMAAMALDPYDANRRQAGTLGLANEPFANQPVYIRLFEDNAGDEDPLVRVAAIRGLSIHGRPEHVPILAKALSDANTQVRLEAARGLQRLHNPVAIDPLLVTIREPDPRRDTRPGVRTSEVDPQVRAEAAHALGQYTEPKVLQGLIAALDDADLSVNRSALQALRTLTGNDFGVDRGGWAAWAAATKNPFEARGVYMYPAFNRTRRIYEYVPFVPQPPNEVATTPSGLPRS